MAQMAFSRSPYLPDIYYALSNHLLILFPHDSGRILDVQDLRVSHTV